MNQRGILLISAVAGLVLLIWLTLAGRNKESAMISDSVLNEQTEANEHDHEDHESHDEKASFGLQLFSSIGINKDWEELVALKAEERASKASAILTNNTFPENRCAQAVLTIESILPENENSGEMLFEEGKLLVDSVLSRDYSESAKIFFSDYAQLAFTKASEVLPERLDVKNALATSKVYLSGDVMGGVQLFLEVINKDPENEAALYNLGMLSIQSGQMDKAEKRFEKLVSLQPENESYARILEDIRSGRTP